MARHLRGMKRIFLVLPLLLTQVGGAKFRAASETLPLIDDLNDAIQQRLLKPMPKSLGMTRIMIRPSFGEHFLPLTSRNRDFAPENDRERKVVAALEDATLTYLVDSYYDGGDEFGVRWDDPEVAMDWGIVDPHRAPATRADGQLRVSAGASGSGSAGDRRPCVGS